MTGESAHVMTTSAAFFYRCAYTGSADPIPFVGLAVLHARHIGADLGVVSANRRIRLRMVRYSRRGIATSAS